MQKLSKNSKETTKLKNSSKKDQKKDLYVVEVSHLRLIDHFTLIAEAAHIVNASANGFLLQVKRTDLKKYLQSNLDLSPLLNQRITLFLPQMELDIEGEITSTKHIGKGVFEISIDFTNEAPQYWREALIDLLPDEGEFDDK